MGRCVGLHVRQTFPLLALDPLHRSYNEASVSMALMSKGQIDDLILKIMSAVMLFLNPLRKSFFDVGPAESGLESKPFVEV